MWKWKSGTSGGSGASENYADWNSRDNWDFSKYGGIKGDVLAWIYMLDKDNGFPLLEMFDDAPITITIEDTNTLINTNNEVQSSLNKRKRGQQGAIKEIGNDLCKAMTEGFGYMTKALETLARSTEPHPPITQQRVRATEDITAEID